VEKPVKQKFSWNPKRPSKLRDGQEFLNMCVLVAELENWAEEHEVLQVQVVERLRRLSVIVQAMANEMEGEAKSPKVPYILI
jgi:hypothetical protein